MPVSELEKKADKRIKITRTINNVLVDMLSKKGSCGGWVSKGG
jgi:hypothetical protein